MSSKPNMPYTPPSTTATSTRGAALPISKFGLGASSTSQLWGQADYMRLMKAYNNVMEFYTRGIFNLQHEEAEKMWDEIRENAPYDHQEIDDYHMKDHMELNRFKGSVKGSSESAEGWEADSEAGYSGLLEYGTAYHGIQYVFFRPSVEIGQNR